MKKIIDLREISNIIKSNEKGIYRIALEDSKKLSKELTKAKHEGLFEKSNLSFCTMEEDQYISIVFFNELNLIL